MSVVATYVRFDSAALDELRQNPDWLTAVYRRRVPGADVIDIDKACDGIAWLLSRLPSPVPAIGGSGFVLRRSLVPLVSGEGGREEPQLEAGYGPAKFVSAAEVAELSSWLAGLDEGELRAAYEPKAMATDGVYPQIWMTQEQAALDEYLVPHFRRLREFVSEAARGNKALLVCFT
jgi:Domain of unknown function (DUF1877)